MTTPSAEAAALFTPDIGVVEQIVAEYQRAPDAFKAACMDLVGSATSAADFLRLGGVVPPVLCQRIVDRAAAYDVIVSRLHTQIQKGL